MYSNILLECVFSKLFTKITAPLLKPELGYSEKDGAQLQVTQSTLISLLFRSELLLLKMA